MTNSLAIESVCPGFWRQFEITWGIQAWPCHPNHRVHCLTVAASNPSSEPPSSQGLAPAICRFLATWARPPGRRHHNPLSRQQSAAACLAYQQAMQVWAQPARLLPQTQTSMAQAMATECAAQTAAQARAGTPRVVNLRTLAARYRL